MLATFHTVSLSLIAAAGAVALLAAPAHGSDYVPARENFFAPVSGFVPPAPGEHPRLFFRKADLPKLKARAATPEGKMLVDRTKFLLDGANEARTGKNFTMFDGAAFGFLYQMTGDKKYGDLGRQSIEHFWQQGITDKDNRYSVNPPNEEMRAGPSLFAVALAYDLCYDAWPAEFRKDQAQKMMTWKARCKKNGHETGFEQLALRPYTPNPVSNHFGLQVGGAGLTVLALKGDPEITPEQQQTLEKYQAGVHKAALKVMTEDFGQRGYFAEHNGPGVIAFTWTFTPWLKAEQVAGGRNWLSDPAWPNAEWLSLQFAHKTIPTAKAPMYAAPVPGRGGYGGDVIEQNGGHHASLFSQGFGAIQPRHAPALLWVYNHFVEPLEKQQYADQLPDGQKSFDTFSYPHRPMYAFVNWPFDVKEENPEKLLPKAIGDMRFGQFHFRNRWKDADDTIVCITFGARTADKIRRSMVWGLGQQMTFGTLAPVIKGNAKVGQAVIDAWEPYTDGSGTVAAGGSCVAVDYSLSSGADAVVVMAGKGADGKLGGNADKTRTKVQAVEAGGQTFQILTLSAKGEHPAAAAAGDKVNLGGQTISFDGKLIRFAKTAPAQK